MFLWICQKAFSFRHVRLSSEHISPHVVSLHFFHPQHAPQSPTYVWVDGVENLEEYCKGGYYPITISDTLSSPRKTYVVLHKLGYGSYSTVWLAQDTQTKRLVSRKLLTGDPDAADRSKELAILAHLANNVASCSGLSGGGPRPEHPGSQYISRLLDSFEVESPKATHTCLVMNPRVPPFMPFATNSNRTGF
jgi:serine/threonine protein kinase